MPLSDFTYHVTLSGEVEVFPLNEDLVFADAEDDDLGVFVRTLVTELPFDGADFDLFYPYEQNRQCVSVPFTVKKSGVDYHKGLLKIGTSSVSWDVSNCRLFATIAPSGSYRCLRDNWEAEFNMFTNVTEVDVQTFLGTLTESTCGPNNQPAPIQINGFFEQNVSGCLSGPGAAWSLKRAYIEEITPGSSYDHYATFVSEQVTVACSGGSPVPPPGDGWVLITDNCPTDALYGRAPQMIYEGEFSASSGKYWDNRYQVAGAESTEIPNGVLLNDLLVAENPCSNLTIRSNFFGINPSGSSPSGLAYTQALENLQSVVIFDKSDVKRPTADEQATSGIWTYKKLLEHLQLQFNIDWRIQGSVLRIEHVSYYARGQGLDLTLAPYEETIRNLNQYDTSDEGVARFENWQFMEPASSLFQAQRIKYGSCAGDDVEEENPFVADLANNDIGYIQANPDQVSDEGFTFANTYLSGSNYYLITEASEFGGDLLINGHLSWPNLIQNYQLYRRPLPSGNVNNVDTVFFSSIPRRTQTPLEVLYPVDDYKNLDPYELIKSGLGWGEVETAEYSVRNCTLTLNLKHT